MSAWTHVVGNIRIDGIPGMGFNIKDIENAIGPMSLWESRNDNCILPKGSEGSLHYKIIQYANGLCWLTIPIWGDLRDVDSHQEIEKWWNELLPKLGLIRDAILHIRTEGEDPVILTWES